MGDVPSTYKLMGSVKRNMQINANTLRSRHRTFNVRSKHEPSKMFTTKGDMYTVSLFR